MSNDCADCLCELQATFPHYEVQPGVELHSVARLVPGGETDAAHILHAELAAVVHKHDVKRISDRILNDCNQTHLA